MYISISVCKYIYDNMYILYISIWHIYHAYVIWKKGGGLKLFIIWALFYPELGQELGTDANEKLFLKKDKVCRY